MKTKILIVEDNAYKSFTTKQVLATQLRLPVSLVEVQSPQELTSRTAAFDPDMVILCPKGGVMEVLEMMRKRKANRRNTEICVLVAVDFDGETLHAQASIRDRTLTARAA